MANGEPPNRTKTPGTLAKDYSLTPTVQMTGINPGVMNPDNPLIYIGKQEGIYDPGYGRVDVDKYVPLEFYKTQGRQLSAEQTQRVWEIATKKFGYLPSDIQGYDSTFDFIVTEAWRHQLQTGEKITPFEWYDIFGEKSGPYMQGLGTGDGGAAQPTRGVVETVNFTDPGTAKTVLDQALKQYLGRTATTKELSQFKKALMSVQEDMPSVTTTDTDLVTEKGELTQKTRQTGQSPMNVQSFAQAWAQGQEGSAEYQAATDLMDSFISAIAGDIL